ncbi:hypothetical protein [Ignicoccus hospitalis]|uniref:hypothetical protein n=1 Tax=Ignicoccus hospitalis TaxID=160233 RepID=UPI001650B216|nr:hypothetical protein [Ignicoccus hospitalis]HIH91153.1 hypothetical protein [Desulfurococcaceae archaeon]
MCWSALLLLAVLTFGEALYFFFSVVTGNWGGAALSLLAYALLAASIKVLGDAMSRGGLC